jgi:hypothetical protein
MCLDEEKGRGSAFIEKKSILFGNEGEDEDD